MNSRRGTTIGICLAVVLSGCQSAADPRAGASGSPSSSTAQPAQDSASATASTTASPTASPTRRQPLAPAELAVSPSAAATGVRPDHPVVVSITSGTLQSVSVTSAAGTTLAGALNDLATTWRNSDALAGGTTYTVIAAGRGADGAAVTRRSTFTTLKPASTVSATIVPGDDWVVGVGMPVVVTFAQPVQNTRAAQAALTVTSTPAVEGAWRWMSSSEVQWRPKVYWPSGTRVVVRAATSGVELSPGAWGRRTVTSSFQVGRAQISTVDVAKHTLTVTRDGRVLRTIPVTTGKSGFLSRGGIKVIMSREAVVRMDAATTGTDPKDPNYYDLLVRWALRLTYSGEYLHAAPWSVASQGRANVSHGCTGMSTTNGKWMYDNSKVGDVVVYQGSPRPLEWGNGYTLWNRSFTSWTTPQ